jgi:hypothetical protein
LEGELGYIFISTFSHHLSLYLLEFLEALDVLYLTVERELISFRSKVLISDNIGEFELYLGPCFDLACVFEFFDFLFEEAEVERKSDILTLARLLDTEDISRTTYLHIAHRYLESSTEMCIVGYRDEAFLLIACELRLAIHEIASPIDILAPYTTTELME